MLDDETRVLARLSAVITAGTELQTRDELARAVGRVPVPWVEELLLQTYLFAGFPRALNATREWRRVQPEPVVGEVPGTIEQNRANGEVTCAAVYGELYERLRRNIRSLHPLLDEWMIVEGYGKVLSRSGLDLGRRELCVLAACAAAGQDRQLHSHLLGALNVGVDASVVDGVIEEISDFLGPDRAHSVRLLWARVRGK
ncbi:MAG: carboxymuconolactone decarboxylase family protein [Gemmatimonadaceae bacterium]